MQQTPLKATLLAWGVLTAVIALTGLVFIPAALKIPFDFTVNKLFVQDGRDQEVLQQVKDRFSENDGDAIVMLSLKDATWFDPKRLEAVRELHQRIERISFEANDHVLKRPNGCDDPGDNPNGAYDRIQSLSTATVFRRRGESVQIEPLYEGDGFGPTARTEKELMAHP